MALAHASFALLAMAASQIHFPQEWCESGAVQVADAPWIDLPQGTVLPVVERQLAGALEKLLKRNFVPISSKIARILTGQKLATKKDEVFVLARAGLVGGPSVPIHQYLRNRRGAVLFMGSVSRDRKKLLVVTAELTPRFSTRPFAVVVKAPASVTTAASRCLWGG